MNANETPDERVAHHLANGPETWTVVKAADRLWQVVTTEENSYVITSASTKRAALAACSEGFYFKHWHDRARWYAGETPAGHKSWETCKAEQERNRARWAL